MFPTSRVAATLAAALLVALATTAATAQETVLQNDSFMSGQSVVFQGGFVTGEIAASRFLPSGSPSYLVKRIQLLFGGVTAVRLITLRIWNDAAGTTIPGDELFSGEFVLTGSNTALQEIDLVENDVIVTGQFRVGIEFHDDGLPSVANDTDGIQATRNFILAQGIGWAQSNVLGVTGDWVLRAVVTATAGDSADLSVTKVDAPDPVIAGNDLAYTVTVNNAGPSNAASASLSDTLPAGTTFVSLSSPGGWSCTTPAVGAGGTVSCGNASVAPGSAVFTLVVKVGAAVASGTVLTNTATVSSATTDPNPGNDSATATTTVGSPHIDIDGNSSYDALTDGLLIVRNLAGLTGTSLTGGAIGQGATRSTPAEIVQYLDTIRPHLDVDGDGIADALTDGLLMMPLPVRPAGTGANRGSDWGGSHAHTGADRGVHSVADAVAGLRTRPFGLRTLHLGRRND